MKAYYKNKMHSLVLPRENSMIVYVDGVFGYGLNAKEATDHKKTIRKIIETGNLKGTGYRQVELNDALTIEVVAVGERYRKDLDREGILPRDAECRPKEEKQRLLSASGPRIPQEFQLLARKLYESAGIHIWCQPQRRFSAGASDVERFSASAFSEASEL